MHEVTESRGTLDIVVELLSAMSHMGLMDKAWGSEQSAQWLRKLKADPEYIAAEKRKSARFWDHIQRCADEVAKWPAWKRGSIANIHKSEESANV